MKVHLPLYLILLLAAACSKSDPAPAPNPKATLLQGTWTFDADSSRSFYQGQLRNKLQIFNGQPLLVQNNTWKRYMNDPAYPSFNSPYHLTGDTVVLENPGNNLNKMTIVEVTANKLHLRTQTHLQYFGQQNSDPDFLTIRDYHYRR